MQTEKKCPICAEFVKAEAKKCRWCGHFFAFMSLTSGQIIVIASVFSFFAYSFYIKTTLTNSTDAYVFKNFNTNSSGVVIDSYDIQKKPNLKILGTIRNIGNDSWKHIEVEAKFYDKNEKLIDIKTSKGIPLLKPGESADFKIDSCCGDKVSPFAFDRVKLRVSDAFYVQKNEE